MLFKTSLYMKGGDIPHHFSHSMRNFIQTTLTWSLFSDPLQSTEPFLGPLQSTEQNSDVKTSTQSSCKIP